MYDGHSSHTCICLQVIEWSRSHRVIPFILTPHSSHILQPLDIGVFSHFKRVYSQTCTKFMRKNPGGTITRCDLSSFVCKAFQQAATPGNDTNSILKAGIVPLNPFVICGNLLAPAQLLNASSDSILLTKKISILLPILQSKISAPSAESAKTTKSKHCLSGRKVITKDNVFRQLHLNNVCLHKPHLNTLGVSADDLSLRSKALMIHNPQPRVMISRKTADGELPSPSRTYGFVAVQ